jgi:pimeloyl-ACP methyl ester carboxylesterase
MVAVKANNITIEYEESGDLTNPAIILIRGLGTQLIDWPMPFIDGLVNKGFRVVYFDNRDVGLSEKLENAGVPDMAEMMTKMMSGEAISPPYTVDDMALDVIGLMDVLKIETAHIVGISMGGMIAQILAVNHAQRLKSMTSVMSSSGNPDLPRPTGEAAEFLIGTPEDPSDRESVIAHGTESLRVFGSPGYPESEAVRREIYTARYDRCNDPAGVARQMAAIVADGSRVERLKTITVPTLVIHGLDDPLVPVEGGKDTATSIPNAKLELIEGMAHNIPEPLCARLVDLITGHAIANK